MDTRGAGLARWGEQFGPPGPVLADQVHHRPPGVAEPFAGRGVGQALDVERTQRLVAAAVHLVGRGDPLPTRWLWRSACHTTSVPRPITQAGISRVFGVSENYPSFAGTLARAFDFGQTRSTATGTTVLSFNSQTTTTHQRRLTQPADTTHPVTVHSRPTIGHAPPDDRCPEPVARKSAFDLDDHGAGPEQRKLCKAAASSPATCGPTPPTSPTTASVTGLARSSPVPSPSPPSTRSSASGW